MDWTLIKLLLDVIHGSVDVPKTESLRDMAARGLVEMNEVAKEKLAKIDFDAATKKAEEEAAVAKEAAKVAAANAPMARPADLFEGARK
jgi:hypothetical protein